MKRFFTTSFIALALFISAAVAAPVAHATPGADCSPDAGIGCDAGESCTNINAGGNGKCQVAATSGNAAAPDAGAAATPANGATNADLPSGFGTVMIWIMSLFAWLAGVAMTTLNYAVYFTVVTMGSYVSNLTAIGVTWRILRDIGNIVLIFGFIAVGVTTILNVSWYGIKKMLPMLIIVAVFLNFSLFISEAVIDVGNLFATQFYTQINDGALPTAATINSGRGISDTIMAQLGLATIYGDATSPVTAKQILKPGAPWYVGFMGIILFIVLAFVLFSLAFILIARFVVLIFLIIVAPIGFAGLVVPKLDNTAKLWWSTLFEQTITAPVLLLLLYIALTVITDAKFLTGFGTSQALEGSGWLGTMVNGALPSFGPVLLSFLVAMGLLAAVVILSKKMSAFGGGWATKWAGAASFGAVAWAGRNTVGLASNSASRRFRSSKLARVPVVGRSISGVLDRGAKASFDARATGTIKNIPFGGIGAGAAQTGGAKQSLDDAIKAREGYAKNLQLTKGERAKQDEAKSRVGAAQASVKAAGKGTDQKTKSDARETLENAEKELREIQATPKIQYAGNIVRGPGALFTKNTEAAKKIKDAAMKGEDLKTKIANLNKEANPEAETKTEEAKPPPKTA